MLLPATALLATKGKGQSDDSGGKLSKGDASILRFLCAAEILESDLWEQYWELGGNQMPDFASKNPATGVAPTPTGGNIPYTNGLLILDGDMPQYIQDNTDDEFSHANFLLAYLKSKRANTADLDLLVGGHFRTLPGSKATGSTKKGRLTNLTQLTIDTSFWGRYRTDNENPDLDPNFKFAEPVPSLNVGRHTAIPRTDADSNNKNLITAIAFTAGFHFAFIEVGGTSLYPALAQRVSDPHVLRILLSIGPTETMHFQPWASLKVSPQTDFSWVRLQSFSNCWRTWLPMRIKPGPNSPQKILAGRASSPKARGHLGLSRLRTRRSASLPDTGSKMW
jgi:hypothetical protein